MEGQAAVELLQQLHSAFASDLERAVDSRALLRSSFKLYTAPGGSEGGAGPGGQAVSHAGSSVTEGSQGTPSKAGSLAKAGHHHLLPGNSNMLAKLLLHRGRSGTSGRPADPGGATPAGAGAGAAGAGGPATAPGTPSAARLSLEDRSAHGSELGPFAGSTTGGVSGIPASPAAGMAAAAAGAGGAALHRGLNMSGALRSSASIRGRHAAASPAVLLYQPSGARLSLISGDVPCGSAAAAAEVWTSVADCRARLGKGQQVAVAPPPKHSRLCMTLGQIERLSALRAPREGGQRLGSADSAPWQYHPELASLASVAQVGRG